MILINYQYLNNLSFHKNAIWNISPIADHVLIPLTEFTIKDNTEKQFTVARNKWQNHCDPSKFSVYVKEYWNWEPQIWFRQIRPPKWINHKYWSFEYWRLEESIRNWWPQDDNLRSSWKKMTQTCKWWSGVCLTSQKDISGRWSVPCVARL